MTPVLLWIVDHAADIAAGVAIWLAVAIPVAILASRVIRKRDRQVPPGWHRYDPACECAGCDNGEPSSPYLKVPRPTEGPS